MELNSTELTMYENLFDGRKPVCPTNQKMIVTQQDRQHKIVGNVNKNVYFRCLKTVNLDMDIHSKKGTYF